MQLLAHLPAHFVRSFASAPACGITPALGIASVRMNWRSEELTRNT
jgi:hypothetical protein